MNKAHAITITLFLIATGLYFVAPALGVGLYVLGFIVEICAWFSLFDDRKKNKDSKND